MNYRNAILGFMLVLTAMLPLSARATDRPLVVDWARQFGSSELDVGWSLAMDPSGDLIVLGRTHGALPGHTHLGESDAYLAKYDAQGNLRWSNQFGTAVADNAWDVKIDSNGNIYVVGDTKGVLDAQPNAGGTSAYLKKFDPTGALQWTRGINAHGKDTWSALAIDAADNIYVNGESSEGEMGIYTHSNLSKYSHSGALLWSEDYEKTSVGFANDMTFAPDGTLYFAGSVQTTTIPRPNAFIIHRDATLSRFTSEGERLWTQSFGNTGGDYANSVALDSQGNVYLTGSGAEEYGELKHRGFLRKYTTAGSLIWEETFPQFPGQDGTLYSYSVAIDPQGDPYIAGYTNVTDLPNTYSYFAATSHGLTDGFVIKFEQDGHDPVPTMIGTTKNESVYEMVFGPDGRVYVVGTTSGTVDGEPNAGISDVMLVALQLARLGDTDADGDVDDVDLSTAFSAYTGPDVPYGGYSGYRQGNVDGDYDIDDADLATLFSNYTGPMTAVLPEPGTFALLAVAGLSGLASRQRKS